MAIPENPITRKEHFLAKAAGESVNTPEPVTREEMYLDAIASGSGGGGSGGGGGGGSQLPDVRPIDEGKVLQVVNGKWDVANPPLPNATSEAFGKAIYVDGTGGYPDPNTGDSIGRACVFMTEKYVDFFGEYRLDIRGSFLMPVLNQGAMPIFVRKPTDSGYEIGTLKSWSGDENSGTMVVTFPSEDLSYSVNNDFNEYPYRQ